MAFRVGAVHPRARLQVAHVADAHAALGELGARGQDVGYHEVQALRGARGRRGDPGAERYRAGRAGRVDLDDPPTLADRRIDDQAEARLLEVELLRAVYVRDRDEHQFQLVVHG